jgi:hypothetical protein
VSVRQSSRADLDDVVVDVTSFFALDVVLVVVDVTSPTSRRSRRRRRHVVLGVSTTATACFDNFCGAADV